jgi:hypothetical protein
MKLSVTAPAPAGCALIRDVRCWHGGTPNCACFTSLRSGVYAVRLWGDLTRPVWCQPSAAFHAPWYKPPPRAEGYLGSLPHDTWSRCALFK